MTWKLEKENRATIYIAKTTRAKLCELGHMKENYNDVILRLLENQK